MDRTERELNWTMSMRAALDGDQEAYARLLAELATALRGAARRALARAGMGNADIEDAVQEALLAIHVKRHTWDRSKSLGPWVSAIARYKLVDVMRRSGRVRNVALDDLLDCLPDEAVAQDSDERDVERMLRPLKERQREIVRSISVDGCTVRETAERMHMTEVAVRVALHRSLKLLAVIHRNVLG